MIDKDLDLDHFPRKMHFGEDIINFRVVSTWFEFK